MFYCRVRYFLIIAKWIFHNNEDITLTIKKFSSIFSGKVVQKTELSQCKYSEIVDKKDLRNPIIEFRDNDGG